MWYHAAATYDGGTWRLYLNGNLETTLVVAGSPTPRFDSIQQAALGTTIPSTLTTPAGFFQGQMDEARIWNFARSQTEIQATMGVPVTSGTGLLGRWGFDEGSGTTTADSLGLTPGALAPAPNTPTWVAGAPYTYTPTPAGNYGLKVTGTLAANDYVTFGPAPQLGATTFTLEGWIKRTGAGVPTSTGNGGVSAIPLITKGMAEADGSNLDMNYFIGISPSTTGTAANVLMVDFEDKATGLNHPFTAPLAAAIPIDATTWHHVAATYDGTTWRVYLDGFLKGTQFVGAFTPRNDSIQHAAIGTALLSTGPIGGTAQGFFAGAFDEVRIWSYARSDSQIFAGYTREITNATGLLGRWGFNDCCGPPQDSSVNNVPGTFSGSSWSLVPGATFTTAPNTAPVVTAATDPVITLPASALLNGSVTDDLVSGPLTISWTKTSGPGTVSFFNASAATTTAAFSAPGAYVLTLTADDGELSASKSVNIQVNVAPGTNLPPTANAGPDQTITFPAAANLTGTYADDGLPGVDVNTMWSKVSGPGTVTIAQPQELNTTATFSAAGTYVLMLTANDGALSGTDTVTVTVNAAATNAAIDFGGTNAYVTFGVAPALGSSTFTLEAWVRRDGTGVGTSTGSNGLVSAVPVVTKGRAEGDNSNVDMNYFRHRQHLWRARRGFRRRRNRHQARRQSPDPGCERSPSQRVDPHRRDVRRAEMAVVPQWQSR